MMDPTTIPKEQAARIVHTVLARANGAYQPQMVGEADVAAAVAGALLGGVGVANGGGCSGESYWYWCTITSSAAVAVRLGRRVYVVGSSYPDDIAHSVMGSGSDSTRGAQVLVWLEEQSEESLLKAGFIEFPRAAAAYLLRAYGLHHFRACLRVSHYRAVWVRCSLHGRRHIVRIYPLSTDARAMQLLARAADTCEYFTVAEQMVTTARRRGANPIQVAAELAADPSRVVTAALNRL